MTDTMSDTKIDTKADTVLVLGGTGKTGRRLVARLAARGVKVGAASRRPGEGLTLFEWGRRETHGPALAGVGSVFLVAPELVEDPTPLVDPFLDQARRAGVKRVVALSSTGVEFAGEPPDSGRRKLERLIMSSGLEWTILRLTGFAQNFSEGFLLPGILQADAVVTAIGDGAVAYIDADDIAAVAAAALTEDGHGQATHVLTGPEPLTPAEVAAVIGRAAGRAIAHRDLPTHEMAHVLRGGGIPDDYAAMLLRDMEGARKGLGSSVTDVVERVTGRPATRFADFAARAASAWSRP